MHKLFWVALPLLVAATLFAMQALRRQPPSRLALNVWSSVLLLAYVLTTAGLGIFWVANQQLPVFDWHYLFGYGTVLLVALHLTLNFRVVWRYLTRPATASATRRAPAAPGRRRIFEAFGLVLAGGAAFALGMRHGRSELRIESPPLDATGMQPGPPTATLALVERFHAFSSHSRSGVLLRAPGVEWRDPPAAFKRYTGAPRVTLPVPRNAPGRAADLAALGSVLWHTAGVTDRRSGLNLRASPSSGALFPTELYAAVRSITGLRPGLWHYDPQTHALEQLRDGPQEDAALGAAGEPGLRDAAAVILATAIFHRTGHKYRDRTYRYVLADLGHALENLRVSAAAAGFSTRFVTGFDESRAATTLTVDEAKEGVLALTMLGQAGGDTPKPLVQTASRWTPPKFSSQADSPLDVTAAMHAATSLRDITHTKAPSAPRVPSAPATPEDLIRLPAAMATQANVLEIIAKRRSVRRFANTPLQLAALASVLEGMTARTGPLLSSAVRVNVVAHAVTGLPQGVYRHESLQRVLAPRRAPADLRARARAAALDQDVIGNAAAVFVLSIDRAVVAADPLGPARGYRHAFLEAGLLGERIYLEAGARGLGACGVGAFYDDEAAELVAIDTAQEWVVHFTALGVPAG